MAAKQRDYKQEYAARVKRAKGQGFTGYSHQRKIQSAQKARIETLVKHHPERADEIEALLKNHPTAVAWQEVFPERIRVLNYLRRKGKSEAMLAELASVENFWQTVRPILEAETPK